MLSAARDVSHLIRCDCGHTLAAHAAQGCTAERCACVKTPGAVVFDEIAALRPQWLPSRERHGSNGAT